MRIELFGNLQITHEQHPITSVNTNRLQSLLAFLVLHHDAPQSREQLAFLFWPESGESQARTNLRQLLHHLRRALTTESRFLVVDNHTVQWRSDPACSVDVLEFDEAVARAASAGKRGDPAAECHALDEAACLYQDELLRGLYDEWLETKREHYRQQLGQVLNRVVTLLEERREYAAAICHAERLVAQDPLREAYHQLFIRLHAANHDRASALRAYHQCMRVLRRELGVEPGIATRELYAQILKSAPLDDASTEAPPSTATVHLPLVGRRNEWQRLGECWRQAARGPAHLALILGEPGIGKSRLAEELYESCSQRQEAVARARCYAAEGQLAYAPIAEWLRSEPLRVACSRLAQPQLAELARVLPEILAKNVSIPRPHPLTESWERHHFYESLSAAFGAAHKPLLLMIDDLQWCDQDSFEWLHSLFRSELGSKILVLGTARPEETNRDHPFTRLLGELRRSGQVSEFPLAPLNGDETAALATQVATEQFDAAEYANLYKATKGNPLFVVESIRAGLRQSAAPDRIHAVIAGRLVQLSAPAYELAGWASAIGQAFSLDLLAKSTDWDEDSLSRALDELWQRRIIEGQGTHGAEEYDFTHDRLREVAYAELSPVRRRFLHRKVARALEELHGGQLDRVSRQLAAHYEAAGMAEPAIQHYRQAAEVAKQRFADAEAADLLRRALALCRNFPENAKRDAQELELLVLLGPTLVTTQAYSMPEVGETYTRALALSRRLGDKEHIFSVLAGAWGFHIVRGQIDFARDLGQQFCDLADSEDVQTPSTAGHFLVGASLFHLGRFEASQTHLDQALALVSGHSHPALALFAGPDVGVFCRSYLSHVLWQLGSVDQAARRSQEAIAAAEDVANPFSLAIALDYATMFHVLRRESKVALARAEEAAAVCRKHHFAYYLSVAEILAGWAMAMEGDATAGIARLRLGFDSLKSMGAELRMPWYHSLLAEACALTGQVGEALANVSNAFAFQGKTGEAWLAPDLHRVHGDLLLNSGNPEQARASYQRALESAQHLGVRPFELRAAIRLHHLSAAGGDPQDTLLDVLYRRFSEGFATPDLEEARSLLSRSNASQSA